MSHTPTLLEAAAEGVKITPARIIEEFPWAAALSRSDLEMFAEELMAMMVGWKATAQAFADEIVPKHWMDNPGGDLLDGPHPTCAHGYPHPDWSHAHGTDCTAACCSY